MIRRLNDGDNLALPECGVEAQKIRALWMSYSAKYDFCCFYETCGAMFCEQEGKVVLCVFGRCDYAEIAEFLAFIGTKEIFCSELSANELSKYIDCKVEFVNLMRFNGKGTESVIEYNPPFDEVFSVISSAFELPDKMFEMWYLDMSHRVRHNISTICRLRDSVLVVQHDLNGEVLLSQIATLPEKQLMGNASELIMSVCNDYREKKVFVICNDNIVDFYIRLGFVFEQHKAIVTM